MGGAGGAIATSVPRVISDSYINAAAVRDVYWSESVKEMAPVRGE